MGPYSPMYVFTLCGRRSFLLMPDDRCYLQSFGNQTDSSITTLPELQSQNADVTVIGLMPNGAYFQEIQDPVFNARNRIDFESGPTKWSLWLSNTTMGGLGCTEQYQVCGTDYCTELGGFYQMTNSTLLAALKFNENQQAAVEALSYAVWASRMTWTIYEIGDEVLLARDKLYSVNLHLAGLTGSIYSDSALSLGGVYFSAPLSDRQWQLEVEQMHNMALAKMQRLLIYRPAPPPVDLSITYNGKNFIVPPATDAQKRLCSQQKVRSQQHSSFSVFGIFFIIFFGLFIMALRFSLPSVVGLLQKRRGSQGHQRRIQTWTQMDMFHLISFLLDYENDATWEGRDDSVPVTAEYGKKLRWVPRSRRRSHRRSRRRSRRRSDQFTTAKAESGEELT